MSLASRIHPQHYLTWISELSSLGQRKVISLKSRRQLELCVNSTYTHSFKLLQQKLLPILLKLVTFHNDKTLFILIYIFHTNIFIAASKSIFVLVLISFRGILNCMSIRYIAILAGNIQNGTKLKQNLIRCHFILSKTKVF